MDPARATEDPVRGSNYPDGSAGNPRQHAHATVGRGGPFLFGRFSAADAMFAPVVNRLHVYDVLVSTQTRAYMDTIMALPAWKAWIADAHAEPWRIERYDAI